MIQYTKINELKNRMYVASINNDANEANQIMQELLLLFGDELALHGLITFNDNNAVKSIVDNHKGINFFFWSK